MSKYEWERGTIIIPTGAYPKLRRELVTRWNDLQKQKLERASKIREVVLLAGKGKRSYDYVKAIHEACVGRTDRYGYDEDEDEDRSYEIVKLLGLGATGGAWLPNTVKVGELGTKPRAPRLKDLDLRPISKGGSFNVSDATVHLDDAKHSLAWCVGENNHACEHARKHPFSRAVFAALAEICWGRGSGGKIIGNDEYNRDSDGDEGSGGHYVTGAYGPLGGEKPGVKARLTRNSWGHYGAYR